MEGVPDEPPGGDGPDAVSGQFGSGPAGGTAEGLDAGDAGDGRRAPVGGGRPPPQDAPAEEIGGDGGGWADHRPRAAPPRDLPTDAGGGVGVGGDGKMQSLFDAAAVVGSDEESQEQQGMMTGPDAAGGVADADKGRQGAESSTGGNNLVASTVDRTRDAVQPPTVHEYSVTDGGPTSSSVAASTSAAAAQPALRAKKSHRTDPSGDDPTEVDEYCEGGEVVKDDLDQQEEDDNEGQIVKKQDSRGSGKRETRRRKKKSRATGGGGGTSGAAATGSTRSTRRSDLNHRLEQVGVGSRVGIYWPLDKIYYPATIIATHGQWPHTYAFLYDDGETESFDLSKHQQFQILDDAVPKAALDAIATASGGGGDRNNGGEDPSSAAGRTRRRATTANGEDNTAEVQEQGEDWVCPACEVTHPYQKKLCQCRSTRKPEKGNGKVMLCAIPGCPKKDKGPKCHHMCMRHFTGSNDKQDDDGNSNVAAAVAAAKGEEISSKKRAKKAPDRFDGQDITTQATSFDGGDRKSEAKKPKRSESAFRSNNKNELTVDEISKLKSRQSKKKSSSTKTSTSIDRGVPVDESSEDEAKDENITTATGAVGSSGWQCPSCEMINPHGKKLCNCKSTRRAQNSTIQTLCAIPDCPKSAQGSQYNHMCACHYHDSNITDGWTCPHCQTLNYSTAPKCRKVDCKSSDGSPIKGVLSPSKQKKSSSPKMKVGKRDGGGRPAKRKSSRPKSNRLAGEQEEAYSGAADTPAMKKNPYADRERRDSPRIPSKNQCGKCDACMVEDCGKCRFCLDMKKFGGPWKIRQKCSSRPPCANPPSMSAKKSKSMALESLSERPSGTSRAGRPPRVKPAPPVPPAGSIALDPLKPADGVDVPESTESCEWSFDENSRVLLAKFNIGSSSGIDPVHKETLLKMMERDDITVISEGLVSDLNRTLWDMHYVSNLVGDKPYHKVRRFERELIEVPADMPENENDESDKKIAGESGANSTTAAAAAASVQVEDVATSAKGTSTSAAEEASSMEPRQRFHVRHKEVDKNLSMKISDYCKYLDKRSTALQSVAEKRSKKGVDPVNPASREDDLIGRSTDVEGQNPETFTFLTHDGKEETINVIDEVLYLIDYDMVKLLPPLYEDFVNKFKLPDCLPGGQQCMMNAVNVNGRPFMGPNFYVTPPASFTHFHQDGHGTVDSGHQCLSGYNEVVMLRRMPEEHKQRALYILNDQAKKKKRSKYDGLYGLPHGDGLGAKPDWPTTDAIEECRRMNYYPSVFILKPGQFVHINKGRLHAFRKLSPTALPPKDCHHQLRLDTIANDGLGPRECLCVSVAWDWMYKGCTEKGISEEIFSTLHCARLLRGHQLQSLAIPELSVLHTAIQLVAEYEQNNAPADTKRGILPFLADNNGSQNDSEAVKEKLKGIAPAMEYIIDRHERAFKAAEQQRELQASQEDCRTTLDIAGLPDASENPESYALDPYGNGDFHCRLCHEELSNIYMHCDGCENILNKDYNICVSCHGDGKYKEFAQMHPSKITKNSSVNHMGDNHREVRGNICPCKKGKACARCGYCSGCSCKCHQCFTMHMRFSSMDEMIALRERVRNVVGTCPIPEILLGSPDAAASKKAALDSSLVPASASDLTSLEEHEISIIGQSDVEVFASGDQISSREKRAKKRHRDRQSSSSIDEEKKEDSGDTFVASVEKKLNVRGRQKRSKSESSEDSLFVPASDTGGEHIKVDENAMKLDEEEEPRKLRATRKRRRNDEEADISNDEAIAEAMQEEEYVTGRIRVTKSARKTSATKVEDEDEIDVRKIIDVEDGNSATLHRAIGSRHDDEEPGMFSTASPSVKKEVRGKKGKAEDTDDGDWACHLCSSSNDSKRMRCTKCRGWKGGKRPLYAGSPEASRKRDKKKPSISKKKSSAPKKSSPSSRSRSRSAKRPDNAKRSCSVQNCSNESIGPHADNMCEEHYANSQAVNRKRPRDGRALCPIKGCPRLQDSRLGYKCHTHYTESKKRTEHTPKSDESSVDDNDEGIDESPKKSPSDVSDEIDDAKLPVQKDEQGTENEETKKPAASSKASDAEVNEVPQAFPKQIGLNRHIDEDDEEVEMISSTVASAAAAAAAPNHQGRRSSSRASSRATRSRATSVSTTPTGEPKDKVDLIKKYAQSFIAPYANAKAIGKLYPARNGLTATVVRQLLEDHEDSDPSTGMLIAALPKECGLLRDDPNHRNMIRHLYRNFQGEGNLLQKRTGDDLPVSLQERDICVYAAVLEKGFDFLEHFIPYRSKEDLIKIYRRTEDKGFRHDTDHVAHVKHTIGMIERLEGPIEREGGSQRLEV